jgi:hypothetical protein
MKAENMWQLFLGDREAEARVADRLLIPFSQFFSWSQRTHLSTGSHSHGQRINDDTNINKEVRLQFGG